MKPGGSARTALKIMLVDDEEIVHQTITPYLRDSGHEVTEVRDGLSVPGLMMKEDFDLVLLDVRMPKIDGLSLLANIHEIHADTAVVMVSGHADMEMVLQALRLGAADFLTKPMRVLELDAVIEKALRVRSLLRHQRRLRETISGIQVSVYRQQSGHRLVGVSSAIEDVRRQIKLAVDANCDTILVTGETGTGKEVVAREIHFSGKKAGSPFIAVSCPALPDTLVESELFGHRKGAFTGASADKAGYFELAHGGTLFLDEIADLSENAQAKLLRALDTRKIRRIGGPKETDVEVQVVAATNSPLEVLVEAGKFRRDLYFRLNVFSITLPPLRQRREDILPLAEHFLQSYVPGRGLRVDGFSDTARDRLIRYDYPGNARELRNMVERAAILCREGTIGQQHLSFPAGPLGSPSQGSPADEADAIRAALEACRWNRRDAARKLGISYASLRYKLKKHNLS
jgi:two-component system response regulator AtoC